MVVLCHIQLELAIFSLYSGCFRHQKGETMANFSVAECSKKAGCTPQNILKLIKNKKLVATKNKKGLWEVCPSVFYDVFPNATIDNPPQTTMTTTTEAQNLKHSNELLKQQCDFYKKKIEYLNEQIDLLKNTVKNDRDLFKNSIDLHNKSMSLIEYQNNKTKKFSIFGRKK